MKTDNKFSGAFREAAEKNKVVSSTCCTFISKKKITTEIFSQDAPRPDSVDQVLPAADQQEGGEGGGRGQFGGEVAGAEQGGSAKHLQYRHGLHQIRYCKLLKNMFKIAIFIVF